MPIEALLLGLGVIGSPAETSAAPVAGVESSESATTGPSATTGRGDRDEAAGARTGIRSWWDVPAHSPRRFSLVGQLETQIVGLAFGPRVDGLYRPFRASRGANLRVGVGLFVGPEAVSLPVALGWRQHFVPHDRLTLELGAGYEQQSFFVSGLGAISRPSFYAEGGLSVRVVRSGWVGVQGSGGWAPFNRPGPSLAVRLGFRWDFGG